MKCVGCSNELPPQRDPRTRYCSRQCWKRADYRRHRPAYRGRHECRFCFQTFIATRVYQKFCSHLCGRRHRDKLFREDGRYEQALADGLYQRRYFKAQYGMTLEERAQAIADQQGMCKILGCDRAAIHIDHDHDTRQIRGVLCARDNSILDKTFLPQLWSRVDYLCEGEIS